MMDPLYNFPLIAQDLRQEEYVIQVADSLQYLSNIFDDIFQKINKRIDENSFRTQDIVQRVAVCRMKVEKLTNTNKATKVLSDAKYPAMNCFKNYQTIFAPGSNEVVMNRNAGNIKSKLGVFDNGKLQEKLEFYHVKVDNLDLYEWLSENQPNNGLGDIPLQINHINSLLLFNGKEFVYTRENKDVQKFSSISMPAYAEDKRETFLAAAPFSISNRDQAGKKITDSYLYSPGMGEVPIMDVPLDLPHLSGIAGDMQFLSDADLNIAPSATFASLSSDITVLSPNEVTDIIPQLPKVDILEEKVESKSAEIASVSGDVLPKVMPPPPPPPPPPPAPEDAASIGQDVSEPDSQTVTISQPARKTSKAASQPSSAPIPTDNRANLMEAIRQAGGSGKAKLRPASEAAQVEETKKSSTPGGNDLMADLHAKLSMRRKGISGDRAKTSDGSILSVISAMIPQPKNLDLASNAEASSAEDDWD